MGGGGIGGVRGPGAGGGGGVGGGGCRERAEAVQNESQLRQVVQQMVPAVERETGLTFKRPPGVQRRTRAQVRDYEIHKLDSDPPPAETAGDQAAYPLVWLFPDT